MDDKKDKSQIFAIVGKGGVGKTSFSAMFARIIGENFRKKTLLIDADPTMSHLARILGINVRKSIEDVRRNVIKTAAKGSQEEKKELAYRIDKIVSDCIFQGEKYSLITMGQPESAGCFCPSNTLLRAIIEDISTQFELVIIDCEAGIEQISRKVIRSVDYLVIVSDSSMRSIETAENILKTSKKYTSYKKTGLVLNKVRQGQEELLLSKLEPFKIPVLGIIPDDPAISELELRGELLKNLNEDSISYKAVGEIVKKIIK